MPMKIFTKKVNVIMTQSKNIYTFTLIFVSLNAATCNGHERNHNRPKRCTFHLVL